MSAFSTAANDIDTPDLRRAAWMAAAQAGDRRAYEKLLAESVPLIRATARRKGVMPDHLDDVVQETLITIHRVRNTYDPSRSYDAWLSAIAARRAIDALRRGGRRSQREVHDDFLLHGYPEVDDASAATEREQANAHLYAAIQDLPTGQRQAAERLGLQEHSLSEAAALTGRSTGALKVNLHRAVKALRQHFKGEP